MEMKPRALLLGCGHSRERKVRPINTPEFYEPEFDLTTLDVGSNCGADVVWDLEEIPLPFQDNTFDVLGCFDVLEHFGAQGDFRVYFDQMSDYHRILKDGGTMGIIVPIGPDAFADPGHTRFFGVNHFRFLSQSFYTEQLALGLPFTDYRWYITRWWNILHLEVVGDHHIACLLQKA